MEQRIDFHVLCITGPERGERGQAECEKDRGNRDRHNEFQE